MTSRDVTQAEAPRTGGFTAAEAALYFLLAAGLDVVHGLIGRAALLRDGLINPDSYMRLVRLQDSLAAGTPLHAVMRDGSGNGTILHWSHLLDGLLLLLAAPWRAWLGMHDALHAGALTLGPLGIGLLGAAAAWTMATLAERGWRWTAPVLIALAPATAAYGVPGVVHHHVLVAFDALVLAGLAGRIVAGAGAEAGNPPRTGLAFGVCAGMGIWLTPELLPFLMMAFGGIGLGWMLRPAQAGTGVALRQAGLAFLAVIAAALALDPPAAGLAAIEIDRLSRVYVVLAGIVAIICAGLWALDRAGLPPVRRAVVGAALGAGGIGCWLLLYPAFLRGTEGMLDEASARAFLDDIREMKPVGSAVQAIAFLFDGAAALALMLWLAARNRGVWQNLALWLYAALCVAVTLLLGAAHVRFSTYATAIGAACLPVMLSETTRALAARLPGVQALARVSLLGIMMLATQIDRLVGFAGISSDDAAAPSPTCPIDDLAGMLAPYAGEVVLTHMNDVPELLYRTQIRTVGSLYHRNVPALLRLREAWRSPASAVEPAAVRATRAAFILACTRMPADGKPVGNSLYERLGHRQVPPWLIPAATDAASGNVLYRIGTRPTLEGPILVMPAAPLTPSSPAPATAGSREARQAPAPN